MAKQYRTREGAITAVDAKTQLSTLGSSGTPGPLLVPGSAKFITAVHVSNVASNESATNSAYLVRLEGPGISRGSFTTVGGADGGPVATGGTVLEGATRIPVNIACIPNQEVLIFAEAVGADQGTYQGAVTVEFSDAPGPEGEIKGEVTVEGDITAVDAKTLLTNQGSVTTPSRLTPPDAAKVQRIVYAISHDSAADGEVNFLLRLAGDAIKGGEQTIVLGGGSFIDVQSGSDAGRNYMRTMVLDNVDIEVNPSESMDVAIEMVGVDIGTATGAVSVQFA
jgi:hypothetical protein